MPFFAVSGLRVQGAALRSGGQRKLALPDSGCPDPTDTGAALAAFLARRREISGPRRLVLAVFMGAVEDLRRYPRDTKWYAEAYRWVVSDEADWPLAFVAACETLGLDPGAVRTRVLAAHRPPIVLHRVGGHRVVARVTLPARPVRAPVCGLL